MAFSKKAFLDKQAQNYAEIKALRAALLIDGTQPERTWAAHRGAFNIALRHPQEIASAFSAFSHQIAEAVPAVVYEPHDIHTSLAGTPFEEPFCYSGENPKHRQTLATLVRATKQVWQTFKHKNCSIRYDSYLYTQQAVLARGEPDENFCELLALLESACLAENLAVRVTWGSHVTVSRFIATCTPRECDDLIRLLEDAKGPGLSVASRVSVGYSLWGASPEFPDVNLHTLNGHFVAHQTFSF